MKDRKKQSNSLWLYRKESILTALVEWIPRAPGVVMRNWVYRSLFAKIGDSVRIKSGVEFIQPRYIEIGDNVTINREVYISSGDRNKTQIGNNRICLEEQVNIGYGVQISTSGKNSQIHLKKKVILDRGVDIRALNEGSIEIDEFVYIGPYSCVAGPGPVKIGKSCLISSHSGIYGNNHNFADPTHLIREQGITFKGITIEDDCWLGTGVKVLDGVTIGKGSVIGAGAVVTKDIPAYSIAVGVPAKVISHRNKKIFQHQKLNGTTINGLREKQVPEVGSST